MSSTPPSPTGSTDAQFDLRPVDLNDPIALRRAVSLLLTGWVQEGSAGTEAFLGFLEQQKVQVGACWQAYVEDLPRAACVLGLSPGRAAMLFQSPLSGQELVRLNTALIDGVCSAQAPEQMTFVQALVDPHQFLAWQALEGAGFQKLADMSYMRSRLSQAVQPNETFDLPEGLKVVPYNPSLRNDFGECILASYEDTQDCPGLVGLRTVGDILDGHQATGIFRPEWWRCAVDRDGVPAAVLLFNSSMTDHEAELVYLGVRKSWRKKSLGRRLLRGGMAMLRREGVRSLVLAVDESNAPALRLYRSLRFSTSFRKLAAIRVISSGPE